MIGARIGEVLKLQAAITAQSQFQCCVDDFRVSLETPVPPADKALHVGFMV